MINKTNKIARHGDLLIQNNNLANIDLSHVKFKKVQELCLAEGETTGHRHMLRKLDEQAKLEFAQLVDGMAFRVSGGDVELVHEEHTQIILEPGTYIQTFESEYDYFAEEEKKVLD